MTDDSAETTTDVEASEEASESPNGPMRRLRTPPLTMSKIDPIPSSGLRS
jgi:hypothetical protein